MDNKALITLMGNGGSIVHNITASLISSNTPKGQYSTEELGGFLDSLLPFTKDKEITLTRQLGRDDISVKNACLHKSNCFYCAAISDAGAVGSLNCNGKCNLCLYCSGKGGI